ncbi:MAG: DUF5063 domain-containing protein [Planctomycetes bacterium]|nr:DUF5063 domain-containing protein [Planctomycetota bacterium]
MDAVDRFAAVASLFEQWARYGTAQGELAARQALFHLTRLYLAALELPSPWSEELADQPEAERLTDEECRTVASACARFPFDFYREVFDPLLDPPEEPVGACISDDISDIYRDVVTGLREYQAGRRPIAVWEWAFAFRHHWGAHATSAIRALHYWVAANGLDPVAGKAQTVSGESDE